jgi:hypothetical protein
VRSNVDPELGGCSVVQFGDGGPAVGPMPDLGRVRRGSDHVAPAACSFASVQDPLGDPRVEDEDNARGLGLRDVLGDGDAHHAVVADLAA